MLCKVCVFQHEPIVSRLQHAVQCVSPFAGEKTESIFPACSKQGMCNQSKFPYIDFPIKQIESILTLIGSQHFPDSFKKMLTEKNRITSKTSQCNTLKAQKFQVLQNERGSQSHIHFFKSPQCMHEISDLPQIYTSSFKPRWFVMISHASKLWPMFCSNASYCQLVSIKIHVYSITTCDIIVSNFIENTSLDQSTTWPTFTKNEFQGSIWSSTPLAVFTNALSSMSRKAGKNFKKEVYNFNLTSTLQGAFTSHHMHFPRNANSWRRRISKGDRLENKQCLQQSLMIISSLKLCGFVWLWSDLRLYGVSGN